MTRVESRGLSFAQILRSTGMPTQSGKKSQWKRRSTLSRRNSGQSTRKIPGDYFAHLATFQRYWTWAWPAGAFGTFNFFSTLGTSCGGGYHPVNGAFQGTFATIPDYTYCNYLLQLGSGDGFEAHLHLSGTAKRVADARMRGMKLVVVEPRLGAASAKADEWIPIRIGTDCAFAMSLMYVMVHEIGRVR